MTVVGFLRWVSTAPTGGNVYDDELAAGLRRLGVKVREHRVDGHWPDASAADKARFAKILDVERDWLVDGIVACAAPDVVAEALDQGRRITVVVHMCLSDEIGITEEARRRYVETEASTLALPVGVLCTSHWAAAELRSRYNRTDVAVAVPGTEPAPVSPGSQPPQLLNLASITPTKDQLTLVAALARLADLPWTARLIGADQVEPRYTEQVRAAVERAHLSDRVRLTGPLVGPPLEAEWARSDLLVLPSRAESYGLVVAEALARGIPAVVSAGTGAVEAQSAGLGPDAALAGTAVPPGDSETLAATLRSWLSDRNLRHSWRAAAEARRPHLPTWDDTARAAASHLPLV
jgi:glycosyltransferase involved in cell wall biosynthesis